MSNRQPERGILARVCLWPGFVLFFFMLYLPVSQNVLMGCLVALVIGVIILKVLFVGSALSLHPQIVDWTLFYAFLGTAYVLLGLIYGAPGAWFSSAIFVVSPLLFLLFIGAATRVELWPSLLRICVLATIAIALGTFEYVLWAVGWLPSSVYFNPGLVNAVVFYDGHVEMSHYSLSSLIFLIPYLMASLVVYDDRSTIFSRRITWVALLFGFAVALLGGRKALLLVVLIAPLLILFFRAQLPAQCRPTGSTSPARVFAYAVALALALMLYFGDSLGLSWKRIGEYLVEGFDPDNADSGAADRAEQLFYLLRGWASHPFFGHGLGSYEHRFIRSDRPWHYELQYALLLFQTGAVGVILYSAGVIWLYWTAVRLIRSGSSVGVHLVPVLVGTTCFLIANASNPYLQAFGQLWTFFLPIGLVNWGLLRDSSSARTEFAGGSAAGKSLAPSPS